MLGDDIEAVVCFPDTPATEFVAEVNEFKSTDERGLPGEGTLYSTGNPATAMNLTQPRLLLVTQDKGLRQAVLSLSEIDEFTVDSAVDHTDAVRKLERTQTPYNILVIDYNEPSAGTQVAISKTIESLRSIKSLCPSIDAIVVTNGDRELGIAALKAGAFDYIDKSVLKNELPFRIEQLFEIQRLKEARRQESLFKCLGEVRRALAAGEIDDELLGIALNGIQIIGFDRVRLYLLSDESRILTARAHIGMKDGFLGTELPLDQCYYMKELLKDPRPRVFKRDLVTPVPFEDILEKAGIDEWASVPLKLRGKIIGKVSVDNKVTGHRIFEDDLDLILPFASEAVEIIENAHQSQRVESLHEAIISITAKENRDDLLRAITEEAMKLVKARNCGIYAYYPERKELVVITDFLHPEFKGKKLQVGQGGAGSLVASGKQYLIISNFDESEYKTEVYENRDFGTVLEVLLISQQEIIGVLYVDDVVERKYTDDDVHLLRLFAYRAATALSHIEHEERLERLIDSSPLGIIEVKRGGAEIEGRDALVTRFNRAAEDILKYKAEEAIGKMVSNFYTDPEEPQKIGYLLRSNNGKLSDYPTQVRTKEGKNVPIRHAATWVLDSAGRRTGSVGFFEDLTSIKEKERQVEILLKASNLIATAENITAGLNALAELVVYQVGGTFCRILFLDEAKNTLVPKSAHRIINSAWNPAIDKVAHISDWPLVRPVLRERKPAVRLCTDPEAQDHLERLATRLELEGPIQSLLAVPLTVYESVIGLLQVGEERKDGGTTFDKTAIDLAVKIGAQTAVLIGRERARLRFESLSKASTALVSPDDPEQVLEDVVESAREAAGASSVSFVQIDEHGRAINLTAVGSALVPDIAKVIRPKGISMQVWETGKPVPVEDTNAKESNFNPEMKNQTKVGAAICLPISIQGSRLGVMWVHYREPRRFRDYEIENLQVCVNQAALAYDSSRRISELKRIREAAKTLAKATTQEEVMKEIVASACKALLADSAVIWFYDGQNFVSELSQAHGIPEDVWLEVRSRGPRPHGTARRVMDAAEGVLEIADVDDSNEIGPTTQKLLRRVGARRFLGVALRADDILGILYVNFKQPRSFRAEEREMVLSFSNQAAFALKRSRLLEQLEKTRRTANRVAEVTTLGDLATTLNSATEGTREALGCDVVTIYVYDPETNRLNSPPSMTGPWYPEEAGRFDTVASDSFVFRVLNSKEIITVPDISADGLFQQSSFAARERIKSCAAIPLRVGEEQVGVMFVNYRKPHVFSESETANIKLFSYQAAIAIQNAKLFDRTKKDLEDREEFLKLSSELLGTLSLQETMNCAVRFAAKAFGEEFCSLVLPHDDRSLVLRSGVGWPPELIGTSYVGRGNKSQSGSTIESREAIIVDDLEEKQKFGVPDIVLKYELKSVLSMPVEIDENVTGVLLIYSKRPRRFGKADIPRLRLIANQTAIAIRSAQHHEATEKARSQVQILYEASKASTTVTWGAERENILGEIVRKAVEHFQPRAVLGTLHTYDSETNELTLVTAYPPDRFERLVAEIGERRPLRGNEKTGYRMGIIGRAVLTGETQIASNDDPDYVELDPKTRSELTVPLKDHNKVIGALNIESNKKNAFDLDDKKTIEALAELALMVISLARQYKTVAARTALAFMSMSGNTWYHTIRNKAASIRLNVYLLRSHFTDNNSLLPDCVDDIDLDAKTIVDFPQLHALSSEKGRRPILLNAHLTQRISLLERKNRLTRGLCKLELSLPNDTMVRADPLWLEEVMNVLLSNAINAMRHSQSKVLTIRTVKEGQKAVMKFSDTGSGIPKAIRNKIFQEPIVKPGDPDTEGWGSGLLMASFIIQVYGGDIAIETTGPSGTTMRVRLPIDEANRA